MKKLIIIAAILMIIMPTLAYAENSSIDDGIDEVLSGTDYYDLEILYNDILGENAEQPFEELVREISKNGLSELTAEQAVDLIFESVKNAVFGNIGIIVQIILIIVAAGILKHMQPSFKDSGVSKAAYFAVYFVIASLCTSILMSAVYTAKDTIEVLASIMEIITPILITLLTAMGGISSSALLSPAMAGITGSVFVLIKEVVFSAIIIAAVLYLISGISSVIKLEKFGALVESFIKWFIGIVTTLYMGITAIKGLSGAALDGLSARTAKFAIDNSVPIVGKMVSDSVDTLVACSLIVKNSIGIVGLILIIAAVLAPIAYLVANMFMVKIAAAIAEPFADSDITKLIEKIAGIIKLVFITLLSCALMVFIAVTLTVGVSNINIMLR